MVLGLGLKAECSEELTKRFNPCRSVVQAKFNLNLNAWTADSFELTVTTTVGFCSYNFNIIVCPIKVLSSISAEE
jgi:hypothetical protein